MFFWDIVFILLGTIIAQVFIKSKELSALFMHFVKSHKSFSETSLKKLEDCIMPFVGVVLIIFLVHPQDVIAQISSGIAWNAGINALFNKMNKGNA